MRLRLLGWLAMALVLAGVFAVGVSGDSGPRTPEERARNIGETIGCPVCAGQSVADSDATPARNIRVFIDEKVAEGLSDDEIRAEVDRRFSDSLLLTPSRSGVVGLVWVLPVAGLVVALAGVGYAFYRWRSVRTGEERASRADRLLVGKALAGLHDADPPTGDGAGEASGGR